MPSTLRECVRRGINPDGSPMNSRYRAVYQHYLDNPPPRPSVHVAECRYRGDETRRIECDTCNPTYKAKIAAFACNCPKVPETETTYRVRIDGLAVCFGCDFALAADESKET